MRYSIISLAAAATSVYAVSSDDCQNKYNACVAAGTPDVLCRCDLTACVGEDAARIRDYCSSASASLAASTAAPTATSSASATGSLIPGTIVQPSGQPQITAPAGSIPLGGTCGASEQCANGAQCWANTDASIRVCGNFLASCTSDSQCAYNKCNIAPGNTGTCNGPLLSSSSASAAPATSATSSASASAPTTMSTSAAGSPTGYIPISGSHTASSPSATSSQPASYTGGASVGATFSGFAAIVAGVAAWVL